MIALTPEPLTEIDASPLADGRCVLAEYGDPDPSDRYASVTEGRSRIEDATATALMDLYRRHRDERVFEALIRLVRPMLEQRVRLRLRCLRSRLDTAEVLQDVVINVYRYPDRFDGSRPGAFRAWSSTIVDNTIRRQLRSATRGPGVQLQPIELLVNAPEAKSRGPQRRAEKSEECRLAFAAMQTFLTVYMSSFQELSDRERFVLQMVEVRGMRYAELAKVLGIRPEALKMVVFRARRRIADRIARFFEQMR